MRQIAERGLWLGSAGDLREVRRVLDAGIAAVVELADDEPFANLSRELVRFRFPLSDGGENPSWLLQLAAESVAALLRANVQVLVCCSAGMSRSVCIAAAAIALVDRLSFHQALTALVDSRPADVSPRLVEQVQRALER
jgi:protein-tyrosine phosphatase